MDKLMGSRGLSWASVGMNMGAISCPWAQWESMGAHESQTQ